MDVGGIEVEHLAMTNQMAPLLRTRVRTASPELERTLGPGPAVTINAYSPPLWRMGSDLIEPEGGLRRFSVSYAEELRPLVGDPQRRLPDSRGK
jgi:hypothetical protein